MTRIYATRDGSCIGYVCMDIFVCASASVCVLVCVCASVCVCDCKDACAYGVLSLFLSVCLFSHHPVSLFLLSHTLTLSLSLSLSFLTQQVVLGCFQVIEHISDKVFSWFPFYLYWKLLVLVWLQISSAEVHTYIRTYIHIYIHIHTYTYTYIHTYIHTYTHITHTYAHAHKYIFVNITHIHALHTRTHTYIHRAQKPCTTNLLHRT